MRVLQPSSVTTHLGLELWAAFCSLTKECPASSHLHVSCCCLLFGAKHWRKVRAGVLGWRLLQGSHQVWPLACVILLPHREVFLSLPPSEIRSLVPSVNDDNPSLILGADRGPFHVWVTLSCQWCLFHSLQSLRLCPTFNLDNERFSLLHS